MHAAAWRDARAPVLFVARYPPFGDAAHAVDGAVTPLPLAPWSAADAAVDAAVRALPVSTVLLHTEWTVRWQRLVTRAAMAPDEAERARREGPLRESDEAHQEAVAARFEQLPFDARVDSTSIKQAVLRLLSLLDIGQRTLLSQGIAK